MSKRTLAISRHKLRKPDSCHEMKNMKIVENNTGWFTAGVESCHEERLSLSQKHHVLHASPRKSAQLTGTEGICK